MRLAANPVHYTRSMSSSGACLRQALLAGIVACHCLAAWSGEFVVDPIRLELSPSARSGVISVRNEGKDKLLFQMQAREWSQACPPVGEMKRFVNAAGHGLQALAWQFPLTVHHDVRLRKDAALSGTVSSNSSLPAPLIVMPPTVKRDWLEVRERDCFPSPGVSEKVITEPP